MKKLILIMMILGMVIPAISQVSKDPFAHKDDTTSTRAIFGVDNRVSAYTYNDYTRATAVAVKSSQFNGNYLRGSSLKAKLLQQAKSTGYSTATVSNSVRFQNEPAMAFCTGFLIAPDILVTAGHCLNSSNYRQMEWVFDYTNGLKYTPGGSIYISPDKRYKVKRLLSHKYNSKTNDDYCVLQLDRPVSRKPFRFRTGNKPKYNDKINTLGSPKGLPLKLVKNGYVSQVYDKQFHTNLDVFGGNSGGPVYNANGFIEGILVSGPVKGKMKGYHIDKTCNCVVEDKYDDIFDPILGYGAVAYRMSNIPWKYKTQAIYENLEYAIKNNDNQRFEDWMAYDWILTDETVNHRMPLAFVAVQNSNLKALKKIIGKGYDVKSTNSSGESLMDIAIKKNDLETVKYLLKEGFDPNFKKGGYKPVLYSAIDSYNADIVKALLDNGADVNYKSYYGDMPLHYAVKNSSQTIVAFLMDRGADYTAKNGSGWNLKKIAKKAKRKDMKKFVKAEIKSRR